MSAQLDEKKHLIILILDKVRRINPAIGTYQRSILTDDFIYAVKLNNGKISVSAELIEDCETNIAFATEDRLLATAETFVPTGIEKPIPPIVESPPANSEPVYELTEEKKPVRHFFKRYIPIIVLALIGLIGYSLINKVNRQNEIKREEEKKESVRREIGRYVTAERSTYQYSNLGGIYNLKISVSNSSDYLIDEVRVKVSYIKANGGLWKEEYLDFNFLSSNSKQTQDAPNSDRGTSIRYEITAIKSRDLDMY